MKTPSFPLVFRRSRSLRAVLVFLSVAILAACDSTGMDDADEQEPPTALEDSEITGLVTATDSATLSVENIPIAWTDATRFVDGLRSRADVQVGDRVEVEVRTVNGTLTAHEVAGDITEPITELEARVDARTASTLTLLGVTLDVTSQTEFYTPFRNLSDVSVGDAVEVAFRRTDTGWTAVEVEPYSFDD